MDVKRANRSLGGDIKHPEEDPLSQLIRQKAINARMAVSMGHITQNSSIPSYMSDFEHQQVLNAAKRVQMPLHLNTPPPLVGNGSTGSSFDHWEANSTLTTKKRAFESEENSKERQLDDFIECHGPLSFNEEF